MNVTVPATAWLAMSAKIEELELPLVGLEVIVGSTHVTLADESGVMYAAVAL